MKDLNNGAFISLFKEAYQKCFGAAFTNPLSETESKHFGNKIFESTGLVIGAKSIKNYSTYIINGSKQENPSVATLDTFARFVLNAPYTDEVQRKNKEAHYPYWFQYKSMIAVSRKKGIKDHKSKLILGIFIIVAGITTVFVLPFFRTKTDESFIDDFRTVDEDSLKKNGWFIQSKDPFWFDRSNLKPRHLTLFTLRGDNWPDSVHTPEIKNLVLRKITSDCFTAEIHINNFIPKQNWQQAGMLLLEDTTLTAKAIRLSIAYNDFFGGYKKPAEIIIQAISTGGKDFSKPEEIAHIPLFSINPEQEALLNNNLRKSALRIEKTGNHFRFLYSTGPVENFAFKEAFSRDLMLKVKYIGIFALQGFVNDTNYLPVHFKFFRLSDIPCE